MSTLEMRATHLPKAKTKPGVGWFARVIAVIWSVFDVLEEAKRQAREAQQRYPFMVE